MSKDLGGAKIYLKREDLTTPAAHKINNVLGQCLLAKRMGKHRICGNRRRPARGGHCHRLRLDGNGLRGVYGQRKTPSVSP